MAKQFKLIKDIFPITKGWTTKVSVAEKTMARESQHHSNKYQRLILIDSEGTRVQASICGANIKLFEDTLIVSKSYQISNAYVKKIKSEHRIVENDLQWTVNGRTLVREVEDDQVMVPAAFSFVSFSDLENYNDCIAHVDIIVLAIDMYPIRQLRTKHGASIIQEVIIVNQESTINESVFQDIISKKPYLASASCSTIPATENVLRIDQVVGLLGKISGSKHQ
ncbi:hypothetical protein QYF36_025313 [Acer negundo]|nr:hypothetical protein QYF36_025313 [Acer negundo]